MSIFDDIGRIINDAGKAINDNIIKPVEKGSKDAFDVVVDGHVIRGSEG